MKLGITRNFRKKNRGTIIVHNKEIKFTLQKEKYGKDIRFMSEDIKKISHPR